MKTDLKKSNKIVVYTDGGSRGNPGPAAIGVFFDNKEYGKFIGVKTNNQAEYEAIIFALRKLKQILGKEKIKKIEVEIRADSEIVIKQLNGQYKILEKDLQFLFIQIWNLKLDFKNVSFTHILREENKTADKIVNKVLNSQFL